MAPIAFKLIQIFCTMEEVITYCSNLIIYDSIETFGD